MSRRSTTASTSTCVCVWHAIQTEIAAGPFPICANQARAVTTVTESLFVPIKAATYSHIHNFATLESPIFANEGAHVLTPSVVQATESRTPVAPFPICANQPRAVQPRICALDKLRQPRDA